MFKKEQQFFLVYLKKKLFFVVLVPIHTIRYVFYTDVDVN